MSLKDFKQKKLYVCNMFIQVSCTYMNSHTSKILDFFNMFSGGLISCIYCNLHVHCHTHRAHASCPDVQLGWLSLVSHCQTIHLHACMCPTEGNHFCLISIIMSLIYMSLHFAPGKRASRGHDSIQQQMPGMRVTCRGP